MQGDVFSLKEAHLKDVPATVFVGYEQTSAKVEVIKILKDGKEAEQINAGDEAKIILNLSPFYAESGGQLGDTGVLNLCSGISRSLIPRSSKRCFCISAAFEKAI